MSFVKVYSGLLDSTLWAERDTVRIMFLTMMMLADRYGRVLCTIPGLAHRARVSVDDAREAIRIFLAADPESRTKGNDGRRIEVIEGGWRLLNYEAYRDLRSQEDRLQQNREAQQRARDRKKANTSGNARASARLLTNDDESAQSADAYGIGIEEKCASDTQLRNAQFEQFWAAYPRKVDRKRAVAVFNKMGPSAELLDRMLAAIQRQSATDQWKRDAGKFIPHPTTWLNGARWDDESSGQIDQTTSSTSSLADLFRRGAR